MPCRNGSLRKGSAGVKPYPRWDLPAYLSRWQAAPASRLAKRARTHHRLHRAMKSFLVRRRSPTSAWRRSMSSTRKIPDHPCSPKIKDWPVAIEAADATMASFAVEVAEAVKAAAVAVAIPMGTAAAVSTTIRKRKRRGPRPWRFWLAPSRRKAALGHRVNS